MSLKEKYPKEYLAHWIGMLSATNCPLNIKGFEEQIQLYKEFEGETEYLNLQDEIKEIISNNDLEEYEEIADYFEMEKMDITLLEKMCSLIIEN